MKCNDVRLFLPDFLDGNLTGDARKTIGGHLAACPGCSQQQGEFVKIETALRQEAFLPAPTELTDRVMASLPVSARSFSLRRELLGAAALLLLLLGAMLAFPLEGEWNDELKSDEVLRAAHKNVTHPARQMLTQLNDLFAHVLEKRP